MAMRPYTILIICLTSVSTAWAHDFGTLIFKDTFDRTESQEERDGPGNEWTTSSDKTAKGHKEVDLRDGHMYIYTHAEANHATSVRHAFEFRDEPSGFVSNSRRKTTPSLSILRIWDSSPSGPGTYLK